MKKEKKNISIRHMDGYYNVSLKEAIQWLKSQMRSYHKGEKFPYEIPEQWKRSISPRNIKVVLEPGKWIFEDAELTLEELVNAE